MNNRNNSRRLLIGSIAAILAIGLTSPAFAAENAGPAVATTQEVIPDDGTWVSITFTGPGIPSEPGLSAAATPFEFNCHQESCWLSVTDGFIAIDWFEVFDGATSIGTTPLPTDDFGASCSGPDDCFADPDFSSAMFCLAPGAHSISFVDLDDDAGSVYPAGAWLRVELHDQRDCELVGGAFSPVDNTALLIAGASASIAWMLPAIVAGIAGAGVYLTRSKWQSL